MSTRADALRWLNRLLPKLEEQRKQIQLPDDYYEGKHRLAFASDKFLEVFGGQFQAFADNWCGVVVDAVHERLGIVGFRFGERPQADDDANRMWQANQLDARSQLGHLDSLITRESAVTVWPDTEDTPRIDIEHPSEVIVATDSSNPHRRLAALKHWTDEWTGEELATVHLPDNVYKFRRQRRTSAQLQVITRPGNREEWVNREVDGEPWPLPNPLETVSVVPLPNAPRLLKPGRSEIADVIPLQNAVNKLVTDMLVSAELGAMPGRWVSGWQEMFEEETNQKVDPKITDYLNRWLTLEDPSANAGTFDVARLENFVKAIELLVNHIAAQSRTPRHYLIQQGQSPSGDAMIAAESGLVAKVLAKQFHLGEAWEEIMRLAFKAIGDRRADVVDAEAMWKHAEFRTPTQQMDAVIKKSQIGVPVQQLWEDAGYSPPKIRRFLRMVAQRDLMATIGIDEGNVEQLPEAIEAEPEGAAA